MKSICLRLIAGVACALLMGAASAIAAPAETIVPADYLVVEVVGQYGRLPLHRDAVEAQIVEGTWKNPADGDTLPAPDGRQESWRGATAENGRLDTKNLRGGYAFTTFDAPADGVMLLEASGHAAVYVNGVLHAGDPYGLGWLKLPVRVAKGENSLLFHVADDELTARLTPPAGVFLNDDDCTLPTIVRGERDSVWAAVPVVNATDDWLEHVALQAQVDEGEPSTTPLPPIPPLSVYYAPVKLEPPAEETGDHVQVAIRVRDDSSDEDASEQDEPLVTAERTLRRVGPGDVQVRTFRSRIDGSVQSYAVRPAAADRAAERGKRPGMLLVLHDVGVDCQTLAGDYAPLEWAHVVIPQGRRPYGFDWEAWGRIDALEALADARKHYDNEPRRTYLAGRGMGGHGVWHLGVTYPDQFAAIGASDSWVSFWSYGGGMPSFDMPTPIEDLILRSYAPSETVKLLRNLVHTGVFVVHDPAADDVPVEQARFLREELAAFHPNFVYYEAPVGDERAAGDSDGAATSRMLEFFQHTARPEASQIASVDFTTADPAISATCDFVIIDAQIEQLVPSHVEMHYDRSADAMMGTTTNVARLGVRLDGSSERPATVTLDGQLITLAGPPRGDGTMWFERNGGRWIAAGPSSPSRKNARRDGTFNAAFDRRAVLVYGTQGNDDENHWAEAKARFDAETFYYRAGGALEVLPDARFDPKDFADRNVILYGNADTNRAWAALLADCPVDVRRGQLNAGEERHAADDLAVVMVRPRADSDAALVGVVSGTGLTGMRLTDRLRWFVSGITYPDLVIFDPSVLTEGTTGIRAWGYFGPDWSLDDGEIAWQDASL